MVKRAIRNARWLIKFILRAYSSFEKGGRGGDRGIGPDGGGIESSITRILSGS